jgi:hypothetical protein
MRACDLATVHPTAAGRPAMALTQRPAGFPGRISREESR